MTGIPIPRTLDGNEFAPFFVGAEDPVTGLSPGRADQKSPRAPALRACPGPARTDGGAARADVRAPTPFAGEGALVSRVRSTVDACGSAGPPGRTQGQSVVHPPTNAPCVPLTTAAPAAVGSGQGPVRRTAGPGCRKNMIHIAVDRADRANLLASTNRGYSHPSDESHPFARR